MARQTSLLDPESVRTCLASMDVSDARKANLVEHVARFYNWKHIPFGKFPSEQKRMEENLLKTERLADVGETSVMLAHDLRNALTGISGSAYQLTRSQTRSWTSFKRTSNMRIE